MKTYRKALADAYVLQSLLDYLAGRADGMSEDAVSYRERAKEEGEDSEDGYYIRSAAEYEAKAAAFERMLEKLSK